ncbi:MAG: GNAT family N-acetyltransferase [Saprospiraceae bacterium]|nr:GNAT family N-acetyltransferase [Saprospiraceae bacterium]
MSRIEFQKLSLKDLDELREISIKTFYESFAMGNTEENMRKYLTEAFSLEQLSAELTDENVEFYFASIHQERIGYIKLNHGLAQTEMKEDNALEIERIYVLRNYQGQKVGQALYEKALHIARQHKLDYIWLGVWEKNTAAIRFYERIGFVEFDRHIFKLGDEDQTDIMLKVRVEHS